MPKRDRYLFIPMMARLAGLWLFTAMWWGLLCLAPLQLHNQVIRHDLWLVGAGFLISLLISLSFQSRLRRFSLSWSSLFSRRAFLVPLVGLIAADMAAIISLRSYVLSFLITTLFLYTLGQAMEVRPISEVGFLLFLSSLGFGLTKGVMDLFRGMPQAGASFFSPQVSGLLHLLGQRSEAVSGTVLFEGKKITCDLMKMGFFPWLAMTLTFTGLVIFSRSSLKRRLITLLTGLLIHYLYLLVRFSLVAVRTPPVMFAGFGPFNLFYWRVLLVSFSPLIFIWFMLLYESRLIESEVAVPELSAGKPSGRYGMTLALFMILGMLAAASLRFHGFMTQRKIHCVIDEIHSDWESSLIDFNQDIYGILAENSYHSLVDYLRHYYPVTQLVNKLSMAPRLAGIDIFPAQTITSSVIKALKDRYPDHQIVLILKCITTPFNR
ncbi:MAG: hypothetical protein ACMUIA_07765, partial [bacterium]